MSSTGAEVNAEINQKLLANSIHDTNNRLKVFIDKLIHEAEKEERSKKPDRKIILEIYGLILNFCQNNNDLKTHKEEIERRILRELEDFLYKELGVQRNIKVTNLFEEMKKYRAKLKNFRLKVNAKNMAESIKNIEIAFEDLIKEILKYLQGMISGAPDQSAYALITLGSLATQMPTPYSDIEYLILLENNNEKHRVYFDNLADLFELVVISLGESPAYKAQKQLEHLFEAYKLETALFKKGTRLDEHKNPQDKNRRYGLIITAGELLEQLPNVDKIIHEPGNHLSAALLTTRFLQGNQALYMQFQENFYHLLSTVEYSNLINTLLEADISACEAAVLTLENLYLEQQLTEKVEIKTYLAFAVHLVRELVLLLQSNGEKIESSANFFANIKALASGKYITTTEAKDWNEYGENLLSLRIEMQLKNKTSEAKITIQDLNARYKIEDICKRLLAIVEIVKKYLQNNNAVQNKNKLEKALLELPTLQKTALEASKSLAISKPNVVSVKPLAYNVENVTLLYEQANGALEESLSMYEFGASKLSTMRDEVKKILDTTKERLHEINSILTNIKKQPMNTLFVELLDIQWKACQNATIQAIASIKTNAEKLQPALTEIQEVYLQIILTKIQQSFEFKNDSIRNNQINIIKDKLFKDSLAQLMKNMVQPTPTCFISYSWGNPANVEMVHKIALDLKQAGIKVVLDVWDNMTGSVHAFTDKIKIADYVIVVGTPDLAEKWHNFTTLGSSRGKTGKDYQGNVVCAELEMILTRLLSKPNDTHGIINLLLQGQHKSSFPNKLEALPSSDTDFTVKIKYFDSFFNLLKRLISNTNNTKENSESYQQMLEKQKKALFDKFHNLYNLDDNILFTYYQKCVEGTQKSAEEILKIPQKTPIAPLIFTDQQSGSKKPDDDKQNSSSSNRSFKL